MALPAVVSGYVSATMLFPALALIAAGLVVFRPEFSLPSTLRPARLLIGVAVFFLLKRLILPLDMQHRIGGLAIDFPTSHAAAQALIAAQIAWVALYDSKNKKASPSYAAVVPCLGMASLCFSFYFFATDSTPKVLAVFALLYAFVYACYSPACRNAVPGSRFPRGRIALALLIFVGAEAFGALAGIYLIRNVSKFDRMMGQFINLTPKSGVGLSNTARLGSVIRSKQWDDQRVLLRVESDRAPGYLRVRCYGELITTTREDSNSERYMAVRAYGRPEDSVWTPLEAPWSACAQMPEPPKGFPKVNPLFQIRAGTLEADTPWLRVLPADLTGENWPLPLEAQGISLAAEVVEVEETGLVRADQSLSPYSAVLGADTRALPPTDTLRQECLGIPNKLEPGVLELGENVMAGAATTQEKIDAALRFFLGWKYDLGIDIPQGRHPLSYFLLKKPAAHCEYYAAGVVALLRIGGVPCRYVTGLHVSEYNTFSGHWIGRNRDAHAWVEAWDDQRGWVTVDATPGGGNQGNTWRASTGAQWMESMRFRWSRWKEAIARLWKKGLPDGTFLLLLLRELAPPALLVGGLSALLLWRKKRRVKARKQRPETPHFAALKRILAQADQQARKHGFQRDETETLHQFAHRIENESPDTEWAHPMAVCYRDYAHCRYQKIPTPQKLDTLKITLQQIRNRP
jgi:protein-glutamine gamma-glutamyltransferase